MLGSKRFELLAKEFEKAGHKTFIVDFPGFEQDIKLSKIFNLTDYVKYLRGFLKTHNITKAIFVCHSFGGRVALKFLSQEPKFAHALILSGTPGFLTVSKVKLRLFLYIAKVGGIVFSLPLIKRIKDHVRKLYYKVIGAKDFYHSQGLMRETFKRIIAEQLVEYMKKIRVPTLLLWGEKDKLVPVAVAKKMQKVLYKSTIVIVKDHGHMFICRNPQMFVSQTNSFLRDL